MHQTDLELKHAGVASFAAFVALSERVLVLWSPRYFERLWCMLEQEHAFNTVFSFGLCLNWIQHVQLSIVFHVFVSVC